jgi:hypothetical protein
MLAGAVPGMTHLRDYPCGAAAFGRRHSAVGISTGKEQ